MKLLDYFLESLVLASICCGVFVFFYLVGNFVALLARLIGVDLW